MRTQTAYKLISKFSAKSARLALAIGIAALAAGCASTPPLAQCGDYLIQLQGNPDESKSIFVFLDGTGNDSASKTNVWKLFNIVGKHKNAQTIGRYIEGVGSVEEPLEEDPMLPILGDALGMGMQTRILEGYDFIASNYKPGDEVFIFGFSRGAHQARALAGLIAYAGVPKAMAGKAERPEHYKHILRILKNVRDDEFLDQWRTWQPGQPPLLAGKIKTDTSNQLDMQPVEVKFLGVWDTVPGSSFKDYLACKERIGFAKRNLYWLPIISRGERYKSDSYPPIRNIAHAVALDEKRSKFAPLYLCEAVAPQHTKLTEAWFPGAHADVGGGYEGSDELPNISLGWMVELLGKTYQFSSQPGKIAGDPKGLAHWSYGDKPANTGSDCEDRKNSADRQPPLGYQLHPSVAERELNKAAQLMIKGKSQYWAYPLVCPGPGK